MNLVVRSTLANRTEFVSLKDDTQQKYREIMDPAKLTELSVLQTQLSDTLKCYAPEASVSLEWAKLVDIDFPLPKAEVKLHEDGYKSSVHRTGHGLQRAFILTMLQHLVAAKGIASPTDEDNASEGEQTEPERLHLPSLILAIEEPELYQHPSRQRHLSSVLLKLAHGTIPGVAKKTQVLYSTHSPLFVGLDRFDQIRLLRKADHAAGKPKATRVAKAELGSVAEKLWDACGRQGDIYNAETLRPRLQAVMTPWVNEGFFADVAVLVEGEDDRAAILGMAQSMGQDFDSIGISVIPCMGKNSLDRPLVIFNQMGIPVYVVWDSDYGDADARPEVNRYLLRLVGQAEDDWPNDIGACHACFKTKLETVFSEEIGNELFNKMLSEVQQQLGITKKKDALKNPTLLRKIVEKAATEGKTSPTLKSIVEKIVAQKPRAGGGQ